MVAEGGGEVEEEAEGWKQLDFGLFHVDGCLFVYFCIIILSTFRLNS